ncbi:SNF2 family N-terminal domain-containing protein [Colletotrichum acutatum]|uniref:SNF2 family N-terminal domain-containing protein n=1 Tax=Glomerella acutata TaxID=27357 RepID=A0AAD8UUN6_GLOAC|nr:SNF2 family N-terminal domain-containing protein [Colletotrichum acutatum]KAK1728108.1 SNF2 family N-terminal domain-containing protein [Colletotrichum acutatum]
MLTSLSAQWMTDIERTPATNVHLILDNEWQLVSSTHPEFRAALDPRGRELLELFHREGISIDILGLTAEQKDVDDDRIQLWITLYGLREIAQGVGGALQEAELYLQDPAFSLTDVEYFNPQRFTNPDGSRTADFRTVLSDEDEVSAGMDETLMAIDVLKSVTSTTVRFETNGSYYLQTELQSHQKQGLTFMLERERGWRLQEPNGDVWSQHVDDFGRKTYINNVNSSFRCAPPAPFKGGILADFMGLGKTLSMISLIAHDKLWESGSQYVRQEPNSLGSGGTLIVVPLSLLDNWEKELTKHLLGDHFNWRRHHAKTQLKDVCHLSTSDIILTTYTTLSKEWKVHVQTNESPIFSHEWHRIILDEAHEIKDLRTAKAQAICELRGDCKWVVTGTPIQNRLSELHSFFHFLGLHPYDDKKAFDRDITNPWLRGEETGPEALKKILGYVMLRRSQDTITLPERRDHRRHLYLSPQEQRMYDAVKIKTIEFIDNALASPRSNDNYSNALEKINALRLVCELGCFQKLNLQQKPASYAGLLPGRPDRQSTPLTPGREREEDEDIQNGNIAEAIDNFCPPLPNLGFNWTQEPSGMLCGSMPTDQWPTKIKALVNDIKCCVPGTKSIVFSYRTSILDVAELALNDAGICCAKIDGKKSLTKRSRIIDDFSKADGSSVLLLSLGCGAVGLTLTAASRAYLLEPQWNPSIEEQALARIHRIGQTQEVTTIRFVISNSIEQYVLDIQNGKRDLMSLLSSKPATSQQLTAKLQQLRQLLR